MGNHNYIYSYVYDVTYGIFLSFLAAFPTGTLLNYLSRTENPINSISYNPGTWKLLGEQRVLKDLKATPPTYIAIVYYDFFEFGYRFFGRISGMIFISGFQRTTHHSS